MSSFAETKTRFRRQTVHGKPLCPDGTTYWKASCFKPLLKCRRRTQSCYTFVSCEEHPVINAQASAGGSNRWIEVVAEIDPTCSEFHEYVVSSGCCGYYCWNTNLSVVSAKSRLSKILPYWIWLKLVLSLLWYQKHTTISYVYTNLSKFVNANKLPGCWDGYANQQRRPI